MTNALLSTPLRCLKVAGAIHVALTIAIFLIGHFQLLPGTFDEHGIGLTFAIDGTSYQHVASRIAEESQTHGFVVLRRVQAPFHSKLYALSFATFGKFLGHNILAAEPLNLFFYLGILTCIYVLGREIFSAQTGLLAASIVAVWPSFLFHSTQLLRDPLAILCFLALMVVLTGVVGHRFLWSNAIAFGIGGAALATLFWIVRGNMWNVVLVALALTCVFLALRMIREKRFLMPNAAVILMIIVAALLVPARVESTTLEGTKPPVTPLAIPSASQPAPAEGIWTRTIKQIGDRRAGFRVYNARGSNIDADVRFSGVSDIVKFIPRAMVIGFFAPFPRMWIQTGSFGFAGRVLSGLETLAMYLLYVAVGFCVWHERRNSKMWLMFLVATTGLVALGLVVVNAGALYRIRYVFWMMLIVIAAAGIYKLTNRAPLWTMGALPTGTAGGSPAKSLNSVSCEVLQAGRLRSQ